jgi:hypothetical protein
MTNHFDFELLLWIRLFDLDLEIIAKISHNQSIDYA